MQLQNTQETSLSIGHLQNVARRRRHEDEQESGAAQLKREFAKIADAEERACLAEAGRSQAQRESRNNLRLLEESRETLLEEQRKSIGELAKLKAEVAEAKGRAEVAEARNREDAFESERRLVAAESSVEESRQRTAAVEDDLERTKARLKEMMDLCDELKGGDGVAAADKENAHASALAASEREEQMASMRAEVAEARKIKDRLTSQAQLEEQLLDARARADRYQQMASDNEELRGRCDQLEGVLARWKTAFEEVRGIDGAKSIQEPEELALRLKAAPSSGGARRRRLTRQRRGARRPQPQPPCVGARGRPVCCSRRGTDCRRSSKATRRRL